MWSDSDTANTTGTMMVTMVELEATWDIMMMIIIMDVMMIIMDVMMTCDKAELTTQTRTSTTVGESDSRLESW